MKKILSSCLLLLSIGAAAQRTCGTMGVLANQLQQDATLQAKMDAIEQQTLVYVNSAAAQKKTRGVVTIPVVVHILHNGEAVGTGANISVAQVMSQIDAMNEDYHKKNADSLPTNHPFYSTTANPEIQFCLATISPNGNPTTGILRYNIGVNSVSDAQMEADVKPQTIWNRDKYLNIWVCKVTAQSSILGYAQFPGGAANTDGVVIQTTAFGWTGNVVAPYDNGRTTVHEVGHWLNLYHIWGDDGGACSGTDNCGDTPNQGNSNYGAPTFPVTDACSPNYPGAMFMNYMDYVDDFSMVMFTQGQKNRMWATLNGPRAGLKTSNGCGLNVAIIDVASPLGDVTIYPNPVQDQFEIQVPINTTKYAIAIVNINGKMVQQVNANAIDGLIKVNIASLPNGVYFVKIKNEFGEVVRRVVKS